MAVRVGSPNGRGGPTKPSSVGSNPTRHIFTHRSYILRILVDLDSTVCNTLPYWLNKIYERTGVLATIDDIDKWDIRNCPPLDQIHPNVAFTMTEEPGFERDIPIMPGARSALYSFWEQCYEICLVTARANPNSMTETADWVEQHLPFLGKKSLTFCRTKHIIQADVIIDDNPETLVTYKHHHPGSLRTGIRYPYNSFLTKNVAHLFDYGSQAWPQISATILNRFYGEQ